VSEKLAFLETEIAARAASFGRSRDWYRGRALWHTLSVAVLSASTTASVALAKQYSQDAWLTVAILAGAALTILTALDGLHSYRNMWVRNNATLMRLYELQSDVGMAKAGAGGDLPDKAVDAFYKRYKRILEEANAGWEGVRKNVPQGSAEPVAAPDRRA
jgi:hypothetical protein